MNDPWLGLLADATTGSGEVQRLLHQLIAVCIFALIGVLVLAVSIWVMTRIVPFSMRKEIEEDQNTSLGIIVGSIIIGIAIIIAAAIMG